MNALQILIKMRAAKNLGELSALHVYQDFDEAADLLEQCEHNYSEAIEILRDRGYDE